MFKQNFERICVEKGYSPTAVCVAVGISKSNYSNWTDGTIPRKTTLIKIAEYLCVSVDELTSDNKIKTTLSEEEKQLVSLIAQLTDEEVKELSNFVDYIISKRK